METSTLPPGPSRATPPPTLRRSHSRILGGVAAGLAESRGIDPVLVRVALCSPLLTAVLAWVGLVFAEQLLGGFAVMITQLLWMLAGLLVLGYLVAWFVIPGPEGRSALDRLLGLRGPAGWAVGALALTAAGVVGLLFFALLGGTAVAFPAFLLLAFAVLCIVGVVALWAVLVNRQGGGRGQPETPVPGGVPGPGLADLRSGSVAPGKATNPPAETVAYGLATPLGPMVEHSGNPFDQHHAPPDVTAPIPDAVQRARDAAGEAQREQAALAEAQRRARSEEQRARRRAARAVRRERNRWGWLVAAVTLMTAGALIVTNRLGVTDLGGLGIGVVCLALLTVGVLVGSVFGSGRWLILPALLLSVPLAAGSYLATAVDHAESATPVLYAPGSLPADEQTRMAWTSGAVTVDLARGTSLDSRSLVLQVDRGSLTVLVPADQWVLVTSDVVAGTNALAPPAFTVGDVPIASSGHTELGSEPASKSKPGQPLYLNLSVGIGDLAVIQKES